MKHLVVGIIFVIVMGCMVTNASGTSWISPGGHTMSSVAIDSSSPYLFVVIRGTDNHLYFNMFHFPEGWAGWTPLGGTTNDEPTIGVTLDGTLHVVIRGTDDVLYNKNLNLDTNTWESTWTTLGGHTSSAPTLLASSLDPAVPPNLWLAIRGTDNHLYLKQWDPDAGWDASWQSWGGTTNDRPALAFEYSMAPGGSTLTLGIRGTDNKVYTRDYAVGTVHPGFKGPWTARGGSTLSPPVVCYDDGVLHIILRGTDNHIYINEGSLPYVSLGGTTNDMPAAHLSGGDGDFLIFIRGTDNKVYLKRFIDGGWIGWANMEGSTLSHPTLSYGLLAIRGTDNGIYLQPID